MNVIVQLEFELAYYVWFRSPALQPLHHKDTLPPLYTREESENNSYVYKHKLSFIHERLKWFFDKERVKTVREKLACNKSSDSHQMEKHFAFSCYFNRRLIQGCPYLSQASTQNGVTAHCSLTALSAGVEKWCCYIFFGCRCNSSYTIHCPFFYLNTQLHILFGNPQTNWPVKSQYVTFLPAMDKIVCIYPNLLPRAVNDTRCFF